MNSDREYYNWRISHGLNVAHLKPPTSAPEPAEPSTPRELDPAQRYTVNIVWVEKALEFCGEGRKNSIKPDLLANLINRVIRNAVERALAARSEGPAGEK